MGEGVISPLIQTKKHKNERVAVQLRVNQKAAGTVGDTRGDKEGGGGEGTLREGGLIQGKGRSRPRGRGYEGVEEQLRGKRELER